MGRSLQSSTRVKDQAKPAWTNADDVIKSGEAVSDGKLKSSEVQLTEHALIVPPDGGWGWVVVFASFMSNFLVDGTVYNVGQIFQPIWTKYFNVSQGTCSWVLAIMTSWYYLAGPIIGGIINIFGCRVAGFTGVAIVSIGFILSMLSPSIYFMYFSFGFIGGLGFGFLYLSSVVIVTYYFDRRRALATGIAVCGSGLGTMAFGPLLQYLNEMYTWQETTLLLTGIILNCAVCCAMYRPLKLSKVQEEKFEQALAYHLQRAASTDDFAKMKPEDIICARSRSSSTTSDGISEVLPVEWASTQNTRQEWFRKRCFSERRDDDLSISSAPKTLFRMFSLPQESVLDHMKRSKAITRQITRQSIMKINRPLNRKDIFFTLGSVSTLNDAVELKTKKSPAYTPDVVSNVFEQVTEEPENLCDTLKRTLMDLLDTSLLLSPTYIAFVIQGGLVCFAIMIPFVYLSRQALSLGYAEKDATLLITYIGAVNIVGRVSCGYISDKPNIDPLSVQNITMVLASLATILLPFMKPYWALIIYCAAFGLALAAFFALRTIVCVNLLGLEKLTNAFGISLIFNGVATLFGSPTAALLYEMTDDYNLSFFTAGATLLLATLIGFSLNPLNRWEQARKKKQNSKTYPVEEMVYSVRL